MSSLGSRREPRVRPASSRDGVAKCRFVERILSVVTTLRLQKRNVLDYLTTACEAALHGSAVAFVAARLSFHILTSRSVCRPSGS
jgi:hypothetical protein